MTEALASRECVLGIAAHAEPCTRYCHDTIVCQRRERRCTTLLSGVLGSSRTTLTACCAWQYAALATQIGTAALLEAPRRGTRPVGPNITKPRAAEQQQHAAAAPADAGLRRVASSPALLAMVRHSVAAGRDDGGAEVTELRHEVAELREQVDDLELKVRTKSKEVYLVSYS